MNVLTRQQYQNFTRCLSMTLIKMADNRQQRREFFYTEAAALLLDSIGFDITQVTWLQAWKYRVTVSDRLEAVNDKLLDAPHVLPWVDTSKAAATFLATLGFQLVNTPVEGDFPIPRYSTPDFFHIFTGDQKAVEIEYAEDFARECVKEFVVDFVGDKEFLPVLHPALYPESA